MSMDKMIEIRGQLLSSYPLFGYLAISQLTLVEDVSCDIAWTNGEQLGFNPDRINNTSNADVLFIYLHEVAHCMLLHHTRKGNREEETYNYACDYVVNSMLKNIGIELAKGCLWDSQFENMTVEQVYSILCQDKNKKEKAAKGKGYGDVKDFEKNKEQNESEIEQEWRLATQRAFIQKNILEGEAGGNVKSIIFNLINPTINWKDVLWRFAEENTKKDYNWSRPNKRYISEGVYLPNIQSKDLDRICVVIDTSCSIQKYEVEQFISEIQVISDSFGCEISIMQCDSKIQKVTDYVKHEYITENFEIYGGGGTDFRPPFEYIKDNDIQPKCLIYFTDMQCSKFSEAPDYPVLWLQTGTYISNPPFGELIRMQ